MVWLVVLVTSRKFRKPIQIIAAIPYVCVCLLGPNQLVPQVSSRIRQTFVVEGYKEDKPRNKKR
jgi:hypothetical protein